MTGMTSVNTTSWMPLLWFGVVLALIPAALWLLKRSGLAPAGLRGAAAGPRLTGSLALGPQQRVVTVEVGEGDERRWLVLGVTAQQITTLHTLTVPPVPPALPASQGLAPGGASARAPQGFSQMLSKALSASRKAEPPRSKPVRAATAVPGAAAAMPTDARRPRIDRPGADHAT